jgi:hypothetical protein
LIKEYNEIIKEISRDENVSYIPFYESIHEQISVCPKHAFTDSTLSILFDVVAHIRTLHGSTNDEFLHKYLPQGNIDEFADQNEWHLHTDGIHLNTRAGMILADLVQKYMDEV